MGEIKKPELVKYFVGMIADSEEMFDRVLKVLEEKYGPVDFRSETIPFDFTDYYKPEMGEGLLRSFAAFKTLMDPEDLADVKIFTNDLEEELAKPSEEGIKRRINIDPGYLSMSKMILASTKNFIHRIYLKKGVFAEITLYWGKGKFHHHDKTFPDYRTEFYQNYFTKLMELYRRQLRG